MIRLKINVGCTIMGKRISLVAFGLACIILFFSGCVEETSNMVSIPDKVFLESDVVEFANISFDKVKNRDGDFIEATLSWLFHNIAGRTINLGIDIQIYDANNFLVYSDSKQIIPLPDDYTESFSPLHNTITLTGKEAQNADHVIIYAFEI